MKVRLIALGARPQFWLTCLLLWLGLSACRSLETPWARIALTEAVRWGAGIGLMLALGRTLRHTSTAARAACVCAGGMALAGVWEGIRPDSIGLVGPYHDHQLYGSALLILLPFPVAVWLTSREIVWRYAALTAGTACALCLILSQTRSAWAGLLISFLVFAVLWCYRSGRALREARFAALAVAALLGTALFLWITLGSAAQQTALAARTRTLSTLSADGSWQGRLTAWRGAARMTAAHPLSGVGLGRYPGTQSAWTQTGRPLDPAARPSLSEEAHSFYLQTAAETGLVGLLLYLAALAAFASQGLRRLRQTRGRQAGSTDALVIAALSMVSGQAVDAIASPSWQFAETSLLFWALLGLGMAAMAQRQTGEAAQPVSSPMPRFWRLLASGAAAIALAANVLPLGLLSPVEAYSSPTGWTYNYAAITPLTQSAHPGNQVTYTFTAHYKTPTNPDQTVDVSQDSTTNWTALVGSTSYTTQFGKNGMAKNVFTVPALANNTVIKISANFKDTRISFVQNNQQQSATLTVISP